MPVVTQGLIIYKRIQNFTALHVRLPDERMLRNNGYLESENTKKQDWASIPHHGWGRKAKAASQRMNFKANLLS